MAGAYFVFVGVLVIVIVFAVAMVVALVMVTGLELAVRLVVMGPFYRFDSSPDLLPNSLAFRSKSTPMARAAPTHYHPDIHPKHH